MTTKRRYTIPAKVAPGRGRKAKGHVPIMLHMPPDAVKALDKRRDGIPRGEFVAAMLSKSVVNSA